MKAKNSLIT